MTEKTMRVRKVLSPVRNQRGVALMTVIFVAAALLVVSSTAAFVTVREFQAGTDDRKATEALAYAEAGVDRMIQYLRDSGTVTNNEISKAGCDAQHPAIAIPPTNIGRGKFTVSAYLYEPTGATPEAKLATLHPRNTTPPDTFACGLATGLKRTSYLAIESIGEHPAAKRVVQQVVKVTPRGLPVGIAADEISVTGTAQTIGISMISPNKIVGRDKIVFTGNDPYYKVGDFWPNGPFPPGVTASSPIPSAAHAVGGIYLKANGSEWEFAGGPKNCTANKATGTLPPGYRDGQSLWDSDGVLNLSPQHSPITSGCTGQTGYPPSSYFTAEDHERVVPHKLDETDHRALKQAAKSYGIYCSISGSSETCIKQGAPFAHSGNWQDGDVASVFGSGTRNFIVYIDFTGGSSPFANSVSWKASAWGCNDDPAVSKSIVVVVKNGGLSLESGAMVNGALLLDGEFKYSGGPIFNGTIVAGKFTVSGNATFSLDECWVRNMPGPFSSVTPVHWSELDR
jgi:hypothetical protein